MLYQVTQRALSWLYKLLIGPFPRSPANWNPWESNANDNQNQTDSGYHNGFQQPTQQQQQQQQPQSSYPILQPTEYKTKTSETVLSNLM